MAAEKSGRTRTPEAHVAAFLAAVRARKVALLDPHGKGVSPMAMMELMTDHIDKIEETGRAISEEYWVSKSAWVDASSIGWSSLDDREESLQRSYTTVHLANGACEVQVEVSYRDSEKLCFVYHLVQGKAGWRIKDCYEIQPDGPGSEEAMHASAAQVRGIRTQELLQPPSQVCEWLRAQSLPAWRLHACRDDAVTHGDSHLGGPFAGNDLATWPRCSRHRTPMVGVLQLWKRDIPSTIPVASGDLFELEAPIADKAKPPFPDGKDVLQVFWCPFDHMDDRARLVRWGEAALMDPTASANPAFLRQPHGGTVPRPCRLFVDRITDYPDVNEKSAGAAWDDVLGSVALQSHIGLADDNLAVPLSNLMQSDIARLEEACFELLRSAPGIKLGGHPSWIQEPEVPVCKCGRRMSHLLSMTSAHDPTEGRWSVEISPQCAHVDFNTELCLGDLGTIYFFVCLTCPGMQSIKSVFQCS